MLLIYWDKRSRYYYFNVLYVFKINYDFNEFNRKGEIKEKELSREFKLRFKLSYDIRVRVRV